jgi:hypothetical protein
MGFLARSLSVGAVVVGCVGLAPDVWGAIETRRRRNTPLSFDKGVSQLELAELMQDVARRTPRVITVDVSGMLGVICVRSSSGLSTWTAEVDFNDYGELTGRYWLRSKNPDSSVPEHYARAVQMEIKSRTLFAFTAAHESAPPHLNISPLT